MNHRKLIAILRGVEPENVLEIGQILIESGFGMIEVTLNSPRALKSIKLLVDAYAGHIQIGAGTVLTNKEVNQVQQVGGEFIISPNCNPNVIEMSKKLTLTSIPGVCTISECFLALDCGADILKIFPSNQVGVEGLKAFNAVLPANVDKYIVGGIGSKDFSKWLSAGASGFGVGSELYKKNLSNDAVLMSATQIIQTYDEYFLSSK